MPKKAKTQQRISYVNGRFVPHRQAFVHIEDRGYQFADGVYEVIALENGRLIDGTPHFARLKRSLKELQIALPAPLQVLEALTLELCRRNRLSEGFIYLQVSRGVAKRDHPFPKKPVKPSVVITVSPPKKYNPKEYTQGVKVISLTDIRWARRDIKSISLLPNILAKQAAAEAGAKEAWLVEKNGIVTEGASSNAYIVDKSGTIRTYPVGNYILCGVTRQSVLALARKKGLKVVEKPFSLKEALAAKEAFMTSTTAGVIPITQIDDKKIGTGKPGATASLLLQLYQQYVSTQVRKKRARGK
jgi:D-alanine transaminase